MTLQAGLRAAAELEEDIRAVALDLARAYPGRGRHPRRAAEDLAMALSTRDPELRAALFRVVDVAPACRDAGELAAHLEAFVGELERPPAPVPAALRAARGPARIALGALTARGVHAMARRFIVGETPGAGAPVLARLWRSGAAA